jgi:hypothetical protein
LLGADSLYAPAGHWKTESIDEAISAGLGSSDEAFLSALVSGYVSYGHAWAEFNPEQIWKPLSLA